MILGLSFLERQEFLLAVEKWTGIMEMKCNIRELRKQNNLTQKELAELSGIGRSHINRIEKGHITPTLEIAFRLAKTLNCKIEDIFSPE